VRRYYSSGTPDGLTISVGEPLAISLSPDASSSVYIASDTDHKIYRYWVASSTVGSFIDVDTAAGSSNPPGTAIALGPEDTNFYMGARVTNRVVRFASSSGAYIDDFEVNGTGGLSSPTGIGFRPPAIGGGEGETQDELPFLGTVDYLDTPMMPTPTSTEEY
jgi:hypothetical protein